MNFHHSFSYPQGNATAALSPAAGKDENKEDRSSTLNRSQGGGLGKSGSSSPCFKGGVFIDHSDFSRSGMTMVTSLPSSDNSYYPFKPFWSSNGALKNSVEIEQEEVVGSGEIDTQLVPSDVVNDIMVEENIHELDAQKTCYFENARLVVLGCRERIARQLSKIWAQIQESAFNREGLFAKAKMEVVAACGVSLLLFLAARFFVPFFWRNAPYASPKSDLRDFVLYEKAKNNFQTLDISELETDAFHTYARTACIQASNLSVARDAVATGLHGIPEEVRNQIAFMAVQEGVSMINSIQDSSADIAENGKAHSFMAFWSTAYDPYSKKSAYRTCVMVTSMTVTVAETVAEWETSSQRRILGSEPCHCGYFTCASCPIWDTKMVKKPIFERRSLSLNKQKELRQWLVYQAIKSSEHLTLEEPGRSHDRDSVFSNSLSYLSWTAADEPVEDDGKDEL